MINLYRDLCCAMLCYAMLLVSLRETLFKQCTIALHIYVYINDHNHDYGDLDVDDNDDDDDDNR